MIDAHVHLRMAHLPSLARLAMRHPKLSVVVDHAAKPERMTHWQAAMTPLAEHINVPVKLSGLLNEVPASDRAAVFGGNAARLYCLEAARD